MQENSSASIRMSRPLLSIGIIGALLILLQVPISLIRGIIQERVQTRDEALSGVTATWVGPSRYLDLARSCQS